MKVKPPFLVLITLVALSAIDRAWADCQENPIGVTFTKDIVKRFKSYDCVLPGTAPSERFTFEFFTFTNQSASMMISGQFPSTLSAIVGQAAVLQTDVGSQFKLLIDLFGERSHMDQASVSINAASAENNPTYEVNNVNAVEIVDRISDYPALKEIRALNQQVMPDNMSMFYVFSESPENSPSDRLQSIIWRYASLQDIIDYPANVSALNIAARTRLIPLTQVPLDVVSEAGRG